jgi:hypothetical protein
LTQTEQLQQSSLTCCWPLTVGLKSTTAVVAGDSSTGAATAAEAGVAGRVGSELAAAAETALVLLQLQPTLHNLLSTSVLTCDLAAAAAAMVLVVVLQA